MPIPEPALQVARGFAMGAADIVPGVSGGTIALVLGIYDRLIRNVHRGAQALKSLVTGDLDGFKQHLGQVEWVWLLSLLAGVLIAVAALSSIIERLLTEQPIRMSALFFGLVIGSIFVAWRMIKHVGPAEIAMMVFIGVALFLLLGLRSDTHTAADAAEVATQPFWIFFLAGSLAICAMILPGISGSFILVMIGMYTQVLGAVNDRKFGLLASFAVGAVIGLALFSTLLNWLLDHYRSLVLAAMVGLMVGSLRVLWPWPGGTNTTKLAAPSGDIVIPILLAIVGLAVVLGIERLAADHASSD